MRVGQWLGSLEWGKVADVGNGGFVNVWKGGAEERRDLDPPPTGLRAEHGQDGPNDKHAFAGDPADWHCVQTGCESH